jgi:DUF971 family protein
VEELTMNEKQPVDSNHPSPKKIFQVDAGVLGITWSDGHESVYPVKRLRENCPCAHCIDEWSGERRIKPGDIADTIQPVKLHSVGLYAIQISWNDGHDTGLYSHELLRRLCACEACRSK